LEYYSNTLVNKAYSTNPEIGKTYYFSDWFIKWDGEKWKE
jgi:hypothetical protein